MQDFVRESCLLRFSQLFFFCCYFFQMSLRENIQWQWNNFFVIVSGNLSACLG